MLDKQDTAVIEDMKRESEKKKYGKRFVSHPLLYHDAVEDRLYQTYIAKTALDKNTLVILPTALGKTVISALVAVETLYNYRVSRVLVMAPTRPLVMQHRTKFESLIRLPEDQFVLLTGKTPQDYRTSVWSSPSRLVFATPQVVRNDLREGRLSPADFKQFGLLVFDECHRSVKEYAYTEVAEAYAKNSPFPLILGMTASPGSDSSKVMMVCKSLSIEHVEHRSDNDPDVRPYINPVTVEWKEIELPLAYQPVKEILRGMLHARLKTLSSKGYFSRNKLLSSSSSSSSNFVSRMDLIDLGSELRYRAEMSIEEERGPLYFALSLQSQALTLFHMIELLDTQGVYTLKCFMCRMEEESSTKKSHLAIVNERAYSSLKQLLDEEKKGPCFVEHPKLAELKTIVLQQLKSNPDSRILVFTQYRDTASHLVEELNKRTDEEKGTGIIRAERFVGQASKLHDKGLTQEEQGSLIEDLRKGYVNTLCATSIAEEGLDIPEVDLVVFYEPIPSEIRYIQRRGRTGRRTAGRVLILAAKDTNDMAYSNASQRRTERMRKIAEALNTKLKPMLTLRVRPPPNPMTREDIAKLESLTLAKAEVAATIREAQQRNDEREVKTFDRMVSRAAHAIYMLMMESSMDGLNEEELYAEMEGQGYQKNTISAALSRLIKRNYLSERILQGKSELDAEECQPTRGEMVKGEEAEGRKKRIAVPYKESLDSRLMVVEVEKIRQGEAVVIVNDKWHARLYSGDYNGPRQLIRRSARFKALCELYRVSGALCIRVKHVVGTMK